MGLAGGSAGVHRGVALDLVGRLVEEVQIVLHGEAVDRTLAQTNVTWDKERESQTSTLFALNF